MTPENIVVRKDRSRLVIEWADGVRIDLTAPELRDLCQSAKSKRLALQGLLAPAAKDLSIEDVSAIGRYGINVVFFHATALRVPRGQPWKNFFRRRDQDQPQTSIVSTGTVVRTFRPRSSSRTTTRSSSVLHWNRPM